MDVHFDIRVRVSAATDLSRSVTLSAESLIFLVAQHMGSHGLTISFERTRVADLEDGSDPMEEQPGKGICLAVWQFTVLEDGRRGWRGVIERDGHVSGSPVGAPETAHLHFQAF
jgi:hypothetical protein